jgi:hypothetical protein
MIGSLASQRKRIHAALTELGLLCGRFGYKHGAPDGAFCHRHYHPFAAGKMRGRCCGDGRVPSASRCLRPGSMKNSFADYERVGPFRVR